MTETGDLSELYKGLAKFRSQLKQPQKDGDNPYFKNGYVTLSGVQKAVDEALKDTGLSYLQLVSNSSDGNVGVETIIAHASGQSISSGVLTLTPAKRDAQGYGSSITYAKRYQLSAMFGVSSDDDDDGNVAVFGGQPQKYQRPQRQQAPRQQRQTPRQPMTGVVDPKREEYSKKLAVAIVTTGKTKNEINKLVKEEAIKEYPNFEKMTDAEKLEISTICLNLIIKGDVK